MSSSPRARVVVVLGALAAFGPLSVDFYLPGLPGLTRDFDAPAWQGQLTLTGCILGLAVGQLAAGALSDRVGRRPPLLVGLVGYFAASIACALAPSIWALIGLRLVQGLCGATGIVIGRSIVRDVATGPAASRLFSIVLVMTALVPAVAPAIGGQLLQVTTWRGLFAVLALVDACILAAVVLWLHETLPAELRRHTGGFAIGALLRDRYYSAHALVLGLAFGALFTYISGSSFVLEDLYGLSPRTYGLVFGVNALGLVACSQLNRVLVGRVRPEAVLRAGVTMQAVAGAVLLTVVLVGGVGLPGILPCLFATVAAIGLIVPNAAMLALSGYAHAAGSASALLGVAQFGIGALLAPLAAGRTTAVPMAILMTVCGVGGLVATRFAQTASRPT